MSKKLVTIEEVYRLVGNAKVSIGSLMLRYGDYPAVFAWNSEKQREVAFVLFERQPQVFEVADFFHPSPLGKFTDDFDDIDELAAYLDAALTTCPRCGGTGEVPYSYSIEAGHWIRDALPCPVCTHDQPLEDERLPF